MLEKGLGGPKDEMKRVSPTRRRMPTALEGLLELPVSAKQAREQAAAARAASAAPTPLMSLLNALSNCHL